MKKIWIALLALCTVFSLVACGGDDEGTGQLYADFSYGDPTGEYLDIYTFSSDEELSPQLLAEELSAMTGLDFAVTITQADGDMYVDWHAESTLIAGLDNREQKEQFTFHDIDTLRWFMMDSLYGTLTNNLVVNNVYYTMEGGQELSFYELYPVNVFPADMPFMGSPFYFNHADNKGDDPYACTEGRWYMDGSPENGYIEMNGEGKFAVWQPDGSPGDEGYLEAFFDGESTRYDMFSEDGTALTSFYFDSATQFHLFDGDNDIFILLESEYD